MDPCLFNAFQIGAKHIVYSKIKADKTTDEQAFGVFFCEVQHLLFSPYQCNDKRI
jgi:hypothetical protein